MKVGSLAPPFALHSADGRSLASLDGRGRPWVLAFARGWSAGGESAESLAAIRAELRGLGAVLLVLSDGGAWSFSPDDDVERIATGGVDLAGEIADAARRYGVAADAVFVIDAGGVVRFAHVSAGPLSPSLADALGEAGRALAARTGAHTFNRREWGLTSLVAGFTAAFLHGCRTPGGASTAPPGQAATALPEELDVILTVNGRERPLRIDARVSLLDALRERLGLTGTKKGCDAGQCGACTVLTGERRVLSCLTLAVMAQGQDIKTIEGLSDGDRLHPVQAAFIEHDGFQCGFCTPGQILSAVALLREGRARSDDEVREQMSGNLCRCGAYPNIVAAIQAARKGAAS
jgi:xanthine dehydrogenase YagT iron-sulfur-binding subunit